MKMMVRQYIDLGVVIVSGIQRADVQKDEGSNGTEQRRSSNERRLLGCAKSKFPKCLIRIHRVFFSL